MYYNIISTERPWIDGVRQIVSIDSKGNRYSVCYGIIPEDEDGEYYHRDFKSMEAAYKAYEIICGSLAFSLYSNEWRIHALEAANDF